ncbi:MAG: hypothetical protein ACD_60C00087G0032 [uncultured bacterium]|nr:MAG: hypothetical protein ACD_60C00087G0032 [uncultured bacterium]
MSHTKKQPIICLMGPTASGKTELAIHLVSEFPFEIVSVDSAMVYRGMDIGTAKPNADILGKAPHRLINIREPKDTYSAAQFCQDAREEIKIIFKKNKIPLLVGGTMLYFRALQQGLSYLPSGNQEIRKKIAERALQLGFPALHQELVKIDPLAALRIHPNDSQRISRALEVYELTGKSLSELQEEPGDVLTEYVFYNIIIAPVDRGILHERIAKRFKEMLANGLAEEVRRLSEKGDLTEEMPAMRSVGYRQVMEYLKGNITFNEMEERGIAATRQLAKRQLTWLRSWPNAAWFESDMPDLYQQVAGYIAQRF